MALKTAMKSSGGKLHCKSCGKAHASSHQHMKKITGKTNKKGMATKKKVRKLVDDSSSQKSRKAKKRS